MLLKCIISFIFEYISHLFLRDDAFIVIKTVLLDHFCFEGLFDEYKVQKNSTYLKLKYFVALQMYLLSLLINLINLCPC